jgi:dsDNA-specific endonuclease/ATPase MutS2
MEALDEIRGIKRKFDEHGSLLKENSWKTEKFEEQIQGNKSKIEKSNSCVLQNDKKVKSFEEKLAQFTDLMARSQNETLERAKLEVLDMKDKLDERWNAKSGRIEDRLEKCRVGTLPHR